jgi:DNA-binding transcriptional ArsR family regulator
MTPDLPIDLLRANSEAMAGRLRLLAHPERLLMLCRMSDEDVTVSELVRLTGLAQSAVSQHLARFRDMGLVSVRREGRAKYYRLVDDDVRQIIGALWEICQARQAET